MKNFFYEDQFYSDIEEFMIALEIDEESIEGMPDFYKCKKAQLEPMFKLSSDWIIERIDEERFSENDADRECEKIEKALALIDFQKVNELIPKLWYESYEKFEITKADLYQALK